MRIANVSMHTEACDIKTGIPGILDYTAYRYFKNKLRSWLHVKHKTFKNDLCFMHLYSP